MGAGIHRLPFLASGRQPCPAAAEDQIIKGSSRLVVRLAGPLSVLMAAAAVPAHAAESGTEAFTKGKPGVAFRYRLENVYQDSFDCDATASTLSVRLNFRTDDYQGFALFIEGDYITEVGWNDFNAGGGNTPDRDQYPLVADPEGGDLNQVYIQ